MIKGIVNQLEALVLVSSSTGLLETEWSLNWLVSHLLALTSEVLSISLNSLNQIHSVIETGDGESWPADSDADLRNPGFGTDRRTS